MTAKVDKVILTNVSALSSRYGLSGVSAIRSSISKLIAADRARGIITKIYRRRRSQLYACVIGHYGESPY